MPDLIKIATRESPLALWQAEDVQRRLRELDTNLDVQLVPMKTRGDRFLAGPLSKIGGKGLFVKELETALLEGRADLAVHSMKDVTAVLPEGLIISTVLEREDPFDAFVSNHYAQFNDLPDGAVVGTCSVRRQAQLLAVRPDLKIAELRGNVNTRLAKLDAGNYDAIILACAGLRRLGFESRIRHPMPVDCCLPAVGQGIIGIEVRDSDHAIVERLHAMHDAPSASRLQAERALSASLNGGCSAPIAGFSTLDGTKLSLRARVMALDGQTVLEETVSGAATDAQAIGDEAAERLRQAGAQALLDAAAAELA